MYFPVRNGRFSESRWSDASYVKSWELGLFDSLLHLRWFLKIHASPASASDLQTLLCNQRVLLWRPPNERPKGFLPALRAHFLGSGALKHRLLSAHILLPAGAARAPQLARAQPRALGYHVKRSHMAVPLRRYSPDLPAHRYCERLLEWNGARSNVEPAGPAWLSVHIRRTANRVPDWPCVARLLSPQC